MRDYERLQGGEDAVAERASDGEIYQLARRVGIFDPAMADALYSEACTLALVSLEPARHVYQRLLEQAARPTSPGLSRPKTAEQTS